MKFFTVKPTRIEINSALSEVQMRGFSIDLEQNNNARCLQFRLRRRWRHSRDRNTTYRRC